MTRPPRIGLSAERPYRVEAQHLIDFAQDGMPAVLSTPSLIGWLERTAREALMPCLSTGESSVGSEIEVSHLAPTPPGQTVTCVARVVGVDGAKVTFQIEARDERELIARGLHRRQIIRTDRFARAVSRKSAPA